MQQYGGIVMIAPDVVQMWRWAYNNTQTLRAIICCTGEDIRGPFSIAAATHRVDRQFTLLVSRGRQFTVDTSVSLTQTYGNAQPLFQIVEEARDLIRSMLDISAELPVDYKGFHHVSLEGNMLDAYGIEFSVAADLPGLASTPQNPAPPIGT